MLIETVFMWLIALTLCELALASSVFAIYGGAATLILTLCAWLVRWDLDLLAFLLGATYGSVLVCLSLAQTHMEGYPGTPAQSGVRGGVLAALGAGMLIAGSSGALTTAGPAGALFVDLILGQGDWLEQVIGAFHVFFYKACAFEALLLNLFLLIALLASLAMLQMVGEGSFGRQSPSLLRSSRIRLVRSFRRQVRRKNASRVRASKR